MRSPPKRLSTVQGFAAVAGLVAPAFSLIAVGFLARAVGLLDDRAGQGLSAFVFALAVPVLIFKTLTDSTAPPGNPWPYWLAYFGAVAVVWGVTAFLVTRVARRGTDEAVIAGFTAAQSNTVFVGLPIIVSAYGDAGAVPLFLLLAVHLPLMVLVATLGLEGRGVRLGALARSLGRNPILVAIAAGGVARLFDVGVPALLRPVVDPIVAAAVPCALVATGIALRAQGVGAHRGIVALIALMKVAVHPALVYVLAVWVLPVPPVWAGVAVLFAACPSGVNAYLLAERHRVGVAEASAAVAVTTGLSVISTVAWLLILGHGGARP